MVLVNTRVAASSKAHLDEAPGCQGSGYAEPSDDSNVPWRAPAARGLSLAACCSWPVHDCCLQVAVDVLCKPKSAVLWLKSVRCSCNKLPRCCLVHAGHLPLRARGQATMHSWCLVLCTQCLLTVSTHTELISWGFTHSSTFDAEAVQATCMNQHITCEGVRANDTRLSSHCAALTKRVRSGCRR